MSDSLNSYTTVNIQCKEIDKISNSICPYELAIDPSLKPSENVVQDLTKALHTLYSIHNHMYASFNPSQQILLATYHNLLTSTLNYIANADIVPKVTAKKKKN